MTTDKKIITYEDLTQLRKKHAKIGDTIVFTSGCYDLLHLGHLLHFQTCKKFGNILIVNIGNDKTVRMLKGKGRPLYSQNMRARLVAALQIVDYVVISEELGKMDHNKLVQLLKPDIYVVNQKDSHINEKRALVESIGAKLATTKRVPPRKAVGISTSALIKKILAL